VRGYAFFAYQISDTDRDDARFARAGTGEDEQRPFRRSDGVRLLWIERFKKIHRYVD
jgi:hypothetical protein